MIFPIVIFYFIFGIIEIIIWYKKGTSNKEIYTYIFLYLILIIVSNLIYFNIIPRSFYKVLENLIKPLK